MRAFLLFSFFALCSILPCKIDADDSVGYCFAKVPVKPHQRWFTGRLKIICYNLGIDGRSLEQMLESITDLEMEVSGYFRNVSISEIAHRIKWMELIDSRNVTLDENALSRFGNLTDLSIWGPTRIHPNAPVDERARLNLARGVFRQTPGLTQIELSGVDFDDESLGVLLELKDQLAKVTIADVLHEAKVFATLAQFMNLQKMVFRDCTTGSPLPSEIMESSAANLQWIEIVNCNFPKLAKDQFAASPKLYHVRLSKTKLNEVEPGAFDYNPNMRVVDLSGNDLRSLPDGLFSKNTKLLEVRLVGNPRLIGSLDGSNFTHVTYEHFRLIFVTILYV